MLPKSFPAPRVVPEMETAEPTPLGKSTRVGLSQWSFTGAGGEGVASTESEKSPPQHWPRLGSPLASTTSHRSPGGTAHKVVPGPTPKACVHESGLPAPHVPK